MYAILGLAGIAIMFFGYDASVMSLVNSNADYLRIMGTDSGSNRDASAIGGLVSLWYGGFAIGLKPLVIAFTLETDHFRGYTCRKLRG